MNLTISGHHLDVTPALKSHLETRLDRVLRHFDHVIGVNVKLSMEKPKEKDRRPKVECTIHVKGREIVAHASDDNMYAAIDVLVDKLDRQVVRHKEQSRAHHHTPLKQATVH